LRGLFDRLDSVLAAQEGPYRACLAAGRSECPIHFDIGAIVTPQLLAAFAALGTMTCVASAGAAELIDSCGTLSTPGKVYALAQDLTSCGTCLVVSADRITIDLKDHTISRHCGGAEQVRPAETDAESSSVTDLLILSQVVLAMQLPLAMFQWRSTAPAR
jgi:hypothetical protein